MCVSNVFVFFCVCDWPTLPHCYLPHSCRIMLRIILHTHYRKSQQLLFLACSHHAFISSLGCCTGIFFFFSLSLSLPAFFAASNILHGLSCHSHDTSVLHCLCANVSFSWPHVWDFLFPHHRPVCECLPAENTVGGRKACKYRSVVATAFWSQEAGRCS